MDPKMDSGMNISYNPFLTNKDSNNNNSSGRPSYTLDERIAMGALPEPASLHVHNLLRILDNLLACEVGEEGGKVLDKRKRERRKM